jgi:predicted metal-dependent HD superfamily phosphohydrolase
MTTAAKPGRYGIEDAFTLSWFKPAYWKTLANLRGVVHPRVSFDGEALQFSAYPFEPSSVFPAGSVAPESVAEVVLRSPSEVRLRNGDIVFVPAPDKEALMAFINRHDVRVERRTSVWGALLDPFLDTSEEQRSIDRQFAWLAELGLDRAAVDRWRREVAVAMIAYNFGTNLWEWGGFDLYDALVAQKACLSRSAFADFYARAMRLSMLDQRMPARVSSGDDIPGVLHSVLLDWFPHQQGRGLKDFDQRWRKRSEAIRGLGEKLAAELTAAYSEPQRHYHTVAHVEACLAELDQVWCRAVRLNEVRWAVLFHDAIYDPRRQDNEARSADWACKVMGELQRPEEEKERVRRMILATAHTGEPRTPDEALLLDVDLSILGADEAAFDAYDHAVRAEYAWVPADQYRKGRAAILRSFLDRERLYHTAPCRRCCENAARGNIRRALDRLRA